MTEKSRASEADLVTRLKQLEMEYDLAQKGLRGYPQLVWMALISAIFTMAAALLPLLLMGRELFSGNQLIIVYLALIGGLIVYASLVFGRRARVRAEITKTKKLLEVSAGEKVR